MAVITSLINGAGTELRQLVASSRQSGSVRACLLATRDREHALNIVKEAICSSEHPLYHFTVAGRRRLDPNTLLWNTVGDCSEPTRLPDQRPRTQRRCGGCLRGLSSFSITTKMAIDAFAWS